MNNEKGFTLLEIMVSVFLMALICLLTSQAFLSGTRSMEVTTTQSKLAAQARQGIEKMTAELRNSAMDKIDVGDDSDSLQFQIPSAISSTGAITWSDWMQYSLGGEDGEQLIRTDGVTGEETVLANNVESLSFVSNNDPDTLTVTVVTNDSTVYGAGGDNGFGSDLAVTLEATVQLRNG